MKIMNVYIVLLMVFLAGCQTETITKYQCSNGQVVDNIELCSQQKCPELNYDTCSRVEFKDKIVEKVVAKYYCADGQEVTSKESCVDYINPSWDLSSNKGDLINKLNVIKDPTGLMGTAVDISKLTVSDGTIEIEYTQKTPEFQSTSVGQTMYEILQETAEYLQTNKKLDYNIKITATTSNGGFVFTKFTSKTDVLKILNYDIGLSEWITGI